MVDDVDLYRSLLRRFLAIQETFADAWRDAITCGDRERARHAVHTVRGTAAQIGANGVAAQASALEARVAGGEPLEPSVPPDLVASLASVHDEITEVLAAPSATKPAPRALDGQIDAELVPLVRSYLVASDAEVNALLSDREADLRAALGPVFDQLLERVEAFDYPTALQELDGRD